MIAEGWIKSQPDKKDKRLINYSLTETGKTMVMTHWPDARQFAADIADLFDDNEFQQFKEMLDRANEQCDARLEEGK